jgi:endoglucanase
MKSSARRNWLQLVSAGAVASGCGVMTAMPDHVDDDVNKLGSGGSTAVSQGTGGSPELDEIPFSDTPVGRHGQLRVQGTLLIDEHDNPVQLKGPSSMWLNWESAPYAESKEGLKWMRDDWKATVIRAAMGIAPANGYLKNPTKAKSQVKTIVENAIELGMYVIVDWHEEEANTHQSEAAAFFSELAQTYGNYPNVIYETFNEPVKQDWSTVLKPYHEAVIAAIRNVDPDNVIVLGTGNWSQYVDQAATDPIQLANIMYTLHFYSCSHTQWLRERGDYALNRGLAIFVTEWGATHADGGVTGSLCLEEAQLWHDWMNQNGLSWAAWKFDKCSDLSCYFKSSAPVTGGWTDEQLNGHGPFVRDRMRERTEREADAY